MSDMIKLASLQSCTGCAACYNACPHSAILMEVDKEGFSYPSIDEGQCVGCGLCMKACPVLSPLEKDMDNQQVYALWSKTDRHLSSSGGAFSAFARFVIDKGGVVWGAAFDKDFHLMHIAIDSLKDLERLRGSKYLQSNIGDTYKQIKRLLKTGRLVLFTGTPCQVAGLYTYLGKRYEKTLITLDLVCHGVPSEKTFRSYLAKLMQSFSGNKQLPENFLFRKLDGWAIVPMVQFAKRKNYLKEEQNVYMEAFFKGYTYRESCFCCQYANLKRQGTYTIADFWGIGKHGKSFGKNIARGVSLVIENTSIENSIINALHPYAYIEKRDIIEAIAENANLRESVKRPKARDTAIFDMLDDKMSLKEYGEKYNLLQKRNIKYYLKCFFKRMIYTFHLYNFFKNLSYKLK